MNYAYGEFDGQPFQGQEGLFGIDKLTDFVLQYGEQALRAMQKAMKDGDSPTSDLLEDLLKQGMLNKDGKGRLKLTPRAVSRMQMRALNEIFANLRTGQRDGHEKRAAGAGGERLDGTKPYAFGDPLTDLDLHATFRNAIARTARDNPQAGRLPIRFREQDFELFTREGTASCSTVVLLDLSGSMTRYGRYLSAKKVALALLAMVRQRFPMDTVDFVGFYSGAQRIPEVALPLVMPKPVTIFDYKVRLKVPIDQIEQAPQHFTNLHMGLQMARRILRKRSGDNKQIFIITDGQPTAHVEGENVFLLYPPDPRSSITTLKEAALCARDDVRLASFALIEDYDGMEWVSFIEQLTRMTRGVAFYTSSGDLAGAVMESYLTGKKRKTAMR
jgi:Ca-activated chloride channel homolog